MEKDLEAGSQPSAAPHPARPAIKTEHVYPPIPVRSFDWRAWFPGKDEESTASGWGATEAEALKDLANQCEGCGGEGVVGGVVPGWNTDSGPDFIEEPCSECFAVHERLSALSKAGA